MRALLSRHDVVLDPQLIAILRHASAAFLKSAREPRCNHCSSERIDDILRVTARDGLADGRLHEIEQLETLHPE